MDRRAFLRTCVRAGIALPASRLLAGLEASASSLARPIFPDASRGWRGESSLAAALRAGEPAPLAPAPMPMPPEGALALVDRFADLRRHFVFEYYPWYGTHPFRHWDALDRLPPLDLGSNYLPRLGAYDSRAGAVLEQHARWIVESGAGAVNLSWWGPGSFEDLAVPLVMDVMRDHGLKVAFHLEPYADDHGLRYAEDVLYLVARYGEKRRWDALLLLQNEDGKAGPVFKSFRSILPPEVADCHGARQRVPDFTPDEAWRRQTDALRRALRGDFDHVTLLADSLNVDRIVSAGFDGFAIYDAFVAPASYARYAAWAAGADVLFSFGVNPGYDAIEPRRIDPAACYSRLPFEPAGGDLDFSRPEDRERAAALSDARILESLEATLAVQRAPRLTNARRGFLLVYLTSFNEWHEGHSFEPMLDAAEIPPEQGGYHNPARGSYRLATLGRALARVFEPAREPLLFTRG